jgi:hypothetical protein
LLSKGLIAEKTSANNVKKYVVLKTENPTTKKQSTIATDFSSEHWNAPTLTLLANIKALGDKWFDKIFNEVSAKINSRRGRGRVVANTNMEEELLQSESSSSDDDDGLMSDGGEQIGGEQIGGDQEQSIWFRGESASSSLSGFFST